MSDIYSPHILCCTNSDYCSYTGVMLTSLLENNRNHHIDIWIAITDRTPDNINRLAALSENYDCSIHFIYVSPEEIETLPQTQGPWPKEAYLRLIVLKFLPREVTKIIYLDGDIIVNTDIAPLWNHPMGDKAIVAVPDINEYIFDNRTRLNISSPYFNAGVMVMDIERCNRLDIADRCIEIISNNLLDYADQDALNIVLDGHVAYASQRWNLVGGYLLVHNQDQVPRNVREMLNSTTKDRAKGIIHYTDIHKPWTHNINNWHPFSSLWHRYRRKSLWHKVAKTHLPLRTKFAIWRLSLIFRYLHSGPYAKRWI